MIGEQRDEPKELSMRQFKPVTVIGRGAYAKVILSRYVPDNKLYALKILKKHHILQKNQEKQILMEKDILAHIDHPFLVKLRMSFQDEKKLYFALQYCPGGQLFTVLADRQRLSEDQSLFYAGQIVLALEELHKHKVIYRDLKAQNVILDAQGYIKLTDFGLSKILDKEQTTLSICGTSEYLAPEMIKKMGYGSDVDWWCLGCLIYEMVKGFPPFQSPSSNHLDLFEKIVYNKPDLSGMSEQLADLLGKLLKKDPLVRLGHNGAEELKTHPWFSKLKWNSLMGRKYHAPFVPNLTSDIDTNNFDEQFTHASIESEEEPNQVIENTNFKDFSFGE